ncbi:LysM peptidoglycan-binding domain-containing protein [Nisaea acidiphila]|uniref:LysM peptidoglycan-binding domain-containing protein n=1 Tax=Nisaea acidiphila TaxID=1862145 RepID=A0A9J7AMZ1_9PROT|nr:LysM domain-containing protein [Nisaea acidiphila]UUX48534.1 LysM peptidoglycan-binding domain-containing protein [Nisaea acidiphila]
MRLTRNAIECALLSSMFIFVSASVEAVDGPPKPPSMYVPGVGAAQIFQHGNNSASQPNVEILLKPHTVSRGETVWGLINDNGLILNDDLIAFFKISNNNYSDPNLIRTGDKIKIPYVKNISSNEKYYIKSLEKTPLTDIQNINFNEQYLKSLSNDYNFQRDLDNINSSIDIISKNMDTIPPEFRKDIFDQINAAKKISEYLEENFITKNDSIFYNKNIYFYDDNILFKHQLGDLILAQNSALKNISHSASMISNNASFYRNTTVYTKNKTSHKPVCGVSIHFQTEMEYRLNSKDRPDRQLPKLSSPATGIIPVAEIRIWGEWENSIVSDKIFISHYPRKEFEIDLLVDGGQDCNESSTLNSD